VRRLDLSGVPETRHSFSIVLGGSTGYLWGIMARSETPDVTLREFRSKHHPNKRWVVYWPAPEPGKPRKSRRFETKGEAEKFQFKKEIEVTNHGRKAAALKNREIGEALWAIEQLEGHGVTLREVVSDYLARHERIKTSMRIDEAIYDFLDTKKAAGKSARYFQDLRARCNRFVTEHGERTLAEIDVATVESWLEGLKVAPVTRNNYRRALSVFFAWGVKRGFCAENPVADAERAKEVAERVAIFEPGELRVILNAAPADLLPFLAIGAFAGLRAEEVRRLRWQDVDFLNERIDVRASVAKSAATRYVPMKEALIEWIQPIARPAGDVAPPGLYKKLTAFRRELETEDREKGRPALSWKQNGLRHSFASYALAECGNAGQVALWLGHDSNKMIFKHYRERVTPEEAAAWFDVKPKREKIEELAKGKEAA